MRRQLVAAALSLLLPAAPVFAQSAGAGASVSVSVTISIDVSAGAKLTAEAADKLYAAGDFAGALKLYMEGYSTYKDAAFLYAIAQCQRSLGLAADAKASFEAYLGLGAKVALKYKAEAEAGLSDVKAMLAAGISAGAKAGVALGGAVIGGVGAGIGAGMKIAGAVKASAKLAISADVSAAIKAQVELADKLYAKAKFPEALKAYADIYVKAPEPALLYAMAQCHIALDHKLEAISLLRGYLSVSAAAGLKFKADAEAALAKLGVPDAPAIAVAIAGQVSASIKAQVELADKLYAAGDFAGALKIYAELYAKAPELPLLYAQAQCYRMLGDIPQATVAFQAYLKAGGSLVYQGLAEAALGEFGAEIPKIGAAVGAAVGAGVSAGVAAGGAVAAAVPSVPPVDLPKIRPYKLPAMALGGLGVVGVGALGIRGIRASFNADIAFNDPDFGLISNSKITVGLGIGGAVVGVAAAVLFSIQVEASVDVKVGSSTPLLAPTLAPGQAGMAAIWSF